MTIRPDPLAYPPRGLPHDEAARYVGVSPSKFDELVGDRRMPQPRKIDGRVVWDRVELDIAFSDFPKKGAETEIEALLEKSRRRPV